MDYELVQERANGTYHVRLTKLGANVRPDPGESWTAAEARKVADRICGAANPPALKVTCPVCKRVIGGSVLACQCPPLDIDNKSIAELAARIAELAAANERDMHNIAATALFQFGEGKTLKTCRERDRIIGQFAQAAGERVAEVNTSLAETARAARAA